MEYAIHLAILVCMYAILAQSFNVCFGLGRLLNLAHIASYSIGAYATALLATEYGWGFGECMAASLTIAAFFALLIGAISLKLSGDYFAIGTLAFAAIVNALLVNWKSLTRGVLGIPGIPRPEIADIDFYQNSNFLILIATVTVVILIFLYFLFNSGFSRALRAQAEDDYGAQALAKNTRGFRNESFIISSAFAGIAGSFFAYYINYIDPTSFSLNEMVFVLSVVVVGQPGSFWGTLAATIFLVLLPEPLRFIDLPPSILGPMRQMLHAVILFAVVYWKRESIFPVQRKI